MRAKGPRRGSFLSTAEVERFLAFFPQEMRDLALELRNVVAAVCPQATERILWGGLSYHDESKGGPIKGGLCQIEVDRDQVRLSFVHGVRLHDPESLLEGDRRSKRYITLRDYEQVPWDSVRHLIEQAARLDPAHFGPL
ncbi:MAG TPA: DUF1801 domain-containing protein [Anaerolineales bacterium]|nr:DUF1801 domain-containing protein [Anaerolineales bacterium]